MLSDVPSAQERIEALVRRANEKAASLHLPRACVQVVLTGEGGGSWAVALEKGGARLQAGTADRPDVILELSAVDLEALLTGRMAPVAAYMSGRVRIRGDIGLLLRLQPLFS